MPYRLAKAAININLAPRDTSEKKINGPTGTRQNPVVSVIALYGNGVKPAISTAQAS